METTRLSIHDTLPLTCSRNGTCCFGNSVLLNPWELVCLAREKKITPRQFRDLYCEFGGIRLKFNGAPGWKNQQACSQYITDFGCSVHMGRPLSCRLYPLGRQIQSEEVNYMYEGSEFPCLEGCSEVTGLPQLTVGEYLKGQATANFEKAQDAYLDVMQNLADIAFELLLDSGLSESGDTKTLPLWRKMGSEPPQALAERIGQEWIDCLMLPEITENLNDPIAFARQHNDLLQAKAQQQFGTIQTSHKLHKASVLMMGVALHLSRALGANPETLAEDWIITARDNGAKDEEGL